VSLRTSWRRMRLTNSPSFRLLQCCQKCCVASFFCRPTLIRMETSSLRREHFTPGMQSCGVLCGARVAKQTLRECCLAHEGHPVMVLEGLGGCCPCTYGSRMRTVLYIHMYRIPMCALRQHTRVPTYILLHVWLQSRVFQGPSRALPVHF
jgi:hypothetical protein